MENRKEIILKRDLRNAIEKNQFRIYLQPIVNLRTKEILAVEALIRWEHPEWGLLSPNEFIPLAEETGFIIDISKWVLREVSKNYRKWQVNKLPRVKISVNFSGMEFYEIDFIENIESVLEEFNLDPSFLIIEITENILLKNSEIIVSHINKLRSLGIKIALDDYGTGYSSLYYLLYFNIDILKISRCFIKDISHDVNKAIVKNTINMANELKIKLVAEGIEKQEQLSVLQEYNCYAGQGYIFSKPIPVEDLEKILVNKKNKSIIVDNVIPLKTVNY